MWRETLRKPLTAAPKTGLNKLCGRLRRRTALIFLILTVLVWRITIACYGQGSDPEPPFEKRRLTEAEAAGTGAAKETVEHLKGLLQLDSNRIDSTNAQIYWRLAEAYAKQGNFEGAYHAFSRYREIRDSLFKWNKNREARAAEQRIDTLNRKNRLAEQQVTFKQNEALLFQKRGWLWAISLTAALLLLGTVFSLAAYGKKRKIYLETKKLAERELALEKLKAQQAGSLKERDKINLRLRNEILPLFQQIRTQLEALAADDQQARQGASLEEVYKIMNRVYAQLEDTTLSLLERDGKSSSFEAAVQRLADTIPADHPLRISVKHSGESKLLPDQENAVYRIIQELLQNIIKHAQADQATIDICDINGGLQIIVADNGRGFSLPDVPQGMGLKTIQQRVSELDGNLQLDTAQGVKCTIFIPYKS